MRELIYDAPDEGIDVVDDSKGAMIRHYTRKNYAHVLDDQMLIPDVAIKRLIDTLQAIHNEKSLRRGSIQ